MTKDWTDSARFDRARESGVRSGAAKRAAGGGHHPTTSEQDYTADEVEFMAAVVAYQGRTGRKFPTWGEVLGVVKGLGYRKGG